ncbi:MAG TPA: sodium:proton antiporter [Pseudonocardia sp.]|jgi:CPA1 family monovalent cation:H+ antiporter|nr:sodium:proton antiporter [Pseudonocardia sp.]
MDGIELLLVVLGAIGVTAVAQRRGLQPALVVVLIAAAVSFVPGLPRFELPPELILGVVAPPLLYSAALDFSFVSFTKGLRPILSLGVGMVVVSTFATGVVAAWAVPGLTLVSGLVLGAVVAPPDAVTALAIGRQLNLPRRLMTILTGESLVNDAAALTIFSVTVAAATGTRTVLSNPVLLFLYAAAVGVLVGLAVAALVQWIRLRLRDSGLETALGLLVPFVAYLVAQQLSASGVLAVVASGFWLGHHDADASFATRLQGRQFWNTAGVLLEAFVFAYMGLQCRFVFADLADSGMPLGTFALAALAVLATVLLVRPFWVFLTYANQILQHRFVHWLAALPRFAVASRRSEQLRRKGAAEPDPRRSIPAANLLVVSWTGMRGVITLAAAAGIPVLAAGGAVFPGRAAIQALAFVVTVGTILLQGLTLPPLIRVLGISAPESELRAKAHEIRRAREISRAATRQVLVAARADPPPGANPAVIDYVIDRTRAGVDARRQLDERETADAEQDATTAPTTWASVEDTTRALRQEMYAAQRQALVDARNAGELDDEVMRGELEHLDYEEAATAYDRGTP